MLVCPNCRTDNLEDSEVCRSCGRSLAPEASPMARRPDRGEEEEPQLDLPGPRRTSAWPLVIGVVVAGLALLGWGLFAAVQPNPCEGRFSSSLFAYCTHIPQGWAGGLRPSGDTYEDRFVPLGEPQAQATVRVSELLDPTVGTEQYVQQFRTSQEANGANLSGVDPLVLDGEQALGWTYSVDEQGGVVRVREVVLVRADGAWRIQLIATEDAYEEARFAFEEMLASWRWKA